MADSPVNTSRESQHPTMKKIPAAVQSEQNVWGEDDSLDFFNRERQTPDDLYPSEKIFLPDALKRADSVLDVGCACGGFSQIMRSFNDKISYMGVDIIPEMLIQAQACHAEVMFAACAGHQLPFPDQSFDLVHCSGATHLNSRYRELIADMWRVTHDQLLFDLRLTEGPSMEGTFRIDFNKTGSGGMLPYIVINIQEAREIIDSLPGRPAHIKLRGYHHPASHNANMPDDENLIMAFLLLSRTSTDRGWDIKIEDNPPT